MSGARAALETIWAVAALQASAASAVAAHPVGMRTEAGEILAGVARDGSRYVLFPVAPGLIVEEDTESDGVRLIGRQLVMGGSTESFATLACARPWLQDAFAEIAGESISRLTRDGGRPDHVVHAVLGEWRELLARRAREGLPEEAVLGLIGEMDTLVRLAEMDPGGALKAWTGPTGGVHDFRNGPVALEVKTTRSRHRRSLMINGVEQLRPPDGTDLFLRVVRVERVPRGAMTLRNLASRLDELGVTRSALNGPLARLGLQVEALPEYDHIAVDVKERLLYRVDDTFPRITPESFVERRLPPGVVTLTYTIELVGAVPSPLKDADFDKLCEELAR